MVQQTAEREHTLTPITSLEQPQAELSSRNTLRDLAVNTPTSSLFRPESGLMDQSYAITQSIDNLARQLDSSRCWQEGTVHAAKFQHVMAETRVLEAKLESLKMKNTGVAPTLRRLSSCDSSSQYLEWEKQLEDQMTAIQTEMDKVKEEVEELNDQVQTLVTDD